MENQIHCTFCGAVIQKDDLFCRSCGHALRHDIVPLETKKPDELLRDQVKLLGELNQNINKLYISQVKIAHDLAQIRAQSEGNLENLNQVKVIDIDMPLGSMVLFMIKWALAAIPAGIILFAIGILLWLLIGGFILSTIGNAVF